MLNISEHFLRGDSRDGGLIHALKRCRPTGVSSQTGGGKTERLTLAFLHSVGTHKETWIPTLERLFDIQARARHNSIVIVEAWLIDFPNHGETAIINERALLASPNGISSYQASGVLHALLGSGLIPEETKLVIVGHSGGTVVAVLSIPPSQPLPYSSLILVESSMFSREIGAKIFSTPTGLISAMETVKARKDIWPSRAVARADFAKRLPWKRWDPRVLDLFVEFGLRDLPTATYPDIKEGVTLACTRVQEAAGLQNHKDSIDALERLADVCAAIPVHAIFGTVHNFMSEDMHNSVIDASQGRKMTSVARIEGAGHLLPQEAPDALAVAIWNALARQHQMPKSML